MLRKSVLSLVALGAVAGAVLGGAGTALASSSGASGLLNSGINLSEPDGSQGINGEDGDCIDVTIPATGSFQHFSGTLTLWTGAGCKTGEAAVITGTMTNIPATFGAQFAHAQSIHIGNNAPPVAGASATLNSGKNFLDPQGAQGIGGNVGEVVRVNIPATGSIQFVSGTLTLYTGPDATGDHLVVTKDVADLAALGFGHVQSIVIGPAA